MNYLLAIVAVIGWVFVLDYRKQNKFLKQKNEGFKNALLAYMTYRYKDLAKIEKLQNELKVCEFGRGK
jgi:hypothetical protein